MTSYSDHRPLELRMSSQRKKVRTVFKGNSLTLRGMSQMGFTIPEKVGQLGSSKALSSKKRSILPTIRKRSIDEIYSINQAPRRVSSGRKKMN